MSPPKPQNDPVQKRLHQFGQHIDGGAEQPDPAENAAENPVEKGLHDLGRQIEECEQLAGGEIEVLAKIPAGNFREGGGSRHESLCTLMNI